MIPLTPNGQSGVSAAEKVGDLTDSRKSLHQTSFGPPPFRQGRQPVPTLLY